MRATIVIGADGVHSRVARDLGQLDDDSYHRAFALRCYYRDLKHVGEDAFFIYDQRFLPAYFWIFPLPHGRANVGVGRFDRFVSEGDPSLPALYDRFVRENSLVQHLLEGGQPESRLKGWPLRLGTSSRSGVAQGAMLVGDANGFIDPLTGEGIHFALRSGQLAAEVAYQAIAVGDPSTAQLSDYTRRWQKEFAEEFRWANHALDMVMSRPFLCDGLVELGARDRSFAARVGEVFSGVRPKRDLLTPHALARVGWAALRVRARNSGALLDDS
jgi:flavin-dependent dehydrogenase